MIRCSLLVALTLAVQVAAQDPSPDALTTTTEAATTKVPATTGTEPAAPTTPEAPPTTPEGPPTTSEAPPTTETEAPAKARPVNRLVYRSTNVLRYNPLGLITDNHVSFRHELYRHDNIVLKDNFVGFGFAPQFSPAFARLGAVAEVQPLSVLRLFANFEVVGYYGFVNLLQSFDSPHADFSDSALGDLGALPDGDPGRNFSTWGTQLTFGADLQAKVGPIAARNLARLVRGSYQLRQGDTAYYDQFYDVLAPNDGWYLNNDTDVFYVTDFGLAAGARVNTTMPFYEERHFNDADRAAGLAGTNPNGPTLRAGPMVTYTFFDEEGAIWNKPTIIFTTQWWLSHRYRTGADVPQAIPYTVIAFQFTGDLIPWR